MKKVRRLMVWKGAPRKDDPDIVIMRGICVKMMSFSPHHQFFCAGPGKRRNIRSGETGNLPVPASPDG